MERIEDSLRRTLRQPEPPSDLSEKVLARISPQQMRARRRFSHYKIAAAATLAVFLSLAGFEYQRRRAERLESQRAWRQVAEAFRLASEQLKPLRQQLEEMQNMTISIPKGGK